MKDTDQLLYSGDHQLTATSSAKIPVLRDTWINGLHLVGERIPRDVRLRKDLTIKKGSRVFFKFTGIESQVSWPHAYSLWVDGEDTRVLIRDLHCHRPVLGQDIRFHLWQAEKSLLHGLPTAQEFHEAFAGALSDTMLAGENIVAYKASGKGVFVYGWSSISDTYVKCREFWDNAEKCWVKSNATVDVNMTAHEVAYELIRDGLYNVGRFMRVPELIIAVNEAVELHEEIRHLLLLRIITQKES